MASRYSYRNKMEIALIWLERAYEERDPILFPVKTVPTLRSLHSDPRFTTLLKKMGLEE